MSIASSIFTSLNSKHAKLHTQGSHSTPDERGAAAAFAVELDDKHGGRPIQMRIVQGKEPLHFMLIFKGTLIIREGGIKSSFTRVAKVIVQVFLSLA